MNHWQIKARNKASEEKRKGRKQGVAIVEYMRRVNGAIGKTEDKSTVGEVVEGTAGEEDQTG